MKSFLSGTPQAGGEQGDQQRQERRFEPAECPEREGRRQRAQRQECRLRDGVRPQNKNTDAQCQAAECNRAQLVRQHWSGRQRLQQDSKQGIQRRRQRIHIIAAVEHELAVLDRVVRVASHDPRILRGEREEEREQGGEAGHRQHHEADKRAMVLSHSSPSMIGAASRARDPVPARSDGSRGRACKPRHRGTRRGRPLRDGSASLPRGPMACCG